MNKLTQDQIAAAMRHYGNSAASFVVGAVVTVIAMGYLNPEQVDRLLQSLNQFADGFGKLLPLLLLIVPYLAQRGAKAAASPEEQVRKVEQDISGVVVTPVTPDGAKLIERAIGTPKPVEVPTVVEQK